MFLQLGLLAGAFAVVVAGWTWVHHLVNTVATQKQAIAQCAADRAGERRAFDTALAVQGKSIEEFKSAAAAREADAAKAVAAAEAKAKPHVAEADRILGQAPKTANLCVESSELMREYVARRRAGTS